MVVPKGGAVSYGRGTPAELPRVDQAILPLSSQGSELENRVGGYTIKDGISVQGFLSHKRLPPIPGPP